VPWSGNKKIKMRERRLREMARGRRRGGGRIVRRAQNAVHSVRNRVRVFRNGGVRRRIRHREFMALRYRVVYVGAIAVLLRFVVMRLNVNEWKEAQRRTREVQGVEGLSNERGSRLRVVTRRGRGLGERGRPPLPALNPWQGRVERGSRWQESTTRERRLDEVERMKALGQFRYTEGRKYVWLAGRVRRVSRRGAVVLTREEGGRKRTKRQRVNEQLSRDSGEAVRRVGKEWQRGDKE
jgi:hypothetical protein